jgi:hypothetical protein
VGRALYDLRRTLALAVTQGTALAALGAGAGCGGNSERLREGATGDTGGSNATGGTSTGGTTATGGSSARGGSSAGGSTATGGSSTGGSPARGGSSTGGSTATGGRGAEGGEPSGGSSALEPYPLDALGCFGPILDGGYKGQCCTTARCYTPDAGTCVGPQAGPPIPLPPGSGSCGCLTTDDANSAVRGPYAPNSEGMASPEGSCCYLVGSIGCEGRPLIVNERPVVAPLALRSDWCAALA